MKKISRILAILLFVVCCVSARVFAQEKQVKQGGSSKNFDMARVITEYRFLEKARAHDGDIFDYLWCRTFLDPNLMAQLDIAAWMSQGRPNLNKYRFWKNFSGAGNVTPGVIYECVGALKLTPDRCKVMLQGMVNKDPSFCAKWNADGGSDRDCLAVVALDPAAATSQESKNLIYFLRAASNFDKNECNKIGDPLLKISCRALVSSDPRECEKCAGFERFKNNY